MTKLALPWLDVWKPRGMCQKDMIKGSVGSWVSYKYGKASKNHCISVRSNVIIE